MTQCELFISIILIVVTCYGMNDNLEAYDVEMVRDLKDYYQAKWIIIQLCNRPDPPVMNLRKEIEKSMIVYISMFTWDDMLKRAVWPRDFKALVLLSCWSCPLDCLLRINDINHHLPLSRFVWLIIGKRSTITNITGIHIRLDCLFIIAERTDSDKFVLWEIYRISIDSAWVKNKIGHWSPRNFNITSVSFIERRSNFNGHNIKTLVESPNSLNRLMPIYKHYEPCYWDLAQRLNFTIEKTTQEEDQYEVSILLRFTDKAADKVYLQPIHRLYQGIYFKDKGVKMQYDGYLQPFDTNVWITIFSVIIFTGLASYFTSKILRRVNKNDDPSYNAYDYIYHSLYILLQKSEFTEQSITQRIITFTQWFTSICLLSCYSAIFISFISVSIPKPPFTTVDGILQTKTHNIVRAKHIDSASLSVIKDSPDVRLRTLYENHFDPVLNVKDDVVNYFCEHDNFLFVTSKLHIDKVRRKNISCRISQTYIKLHVRYLTWTVARGSQYERFFRLHLTKLGLGGALVNRLMHSSTFENLPESDTFRDILLEDVLILFILLAGGVLLSVFIFCAEVAYKLYVRRRCFGDDFRVKQKISFC